MSPLEVLQLVGYSIGAGLPLWMGIQLFSRRRKLNSIERLLFALALTMFGWHLRNLLVTLHGLFGFRYDNWSPALRAVDTLSVVSITFAYSFLLHIHLLLWATVVGDRPLTLFEKLRLALSYGPALFLPIAIYKIWDGPYAPMYSAVNFLVLPMAVWITYVLVVIAATELLIARKSTNVSEQRIMRTLAFSFLGIGAVILAALAFGLGEGTQLGLYLHTLANLGSLLPSALLAYYIYRYRYLELIIEESLIVATFAAVILAVYLYGIRTAGDWVTSRYGVRAGVVEALLILVLALAAAPLRRWLETRFHKLFEREATLYRQIVSRISTQAGQYRELPELLDFVEQQTTSALGLRKVRIAVTPETDGSGEPQNGDREAGPSEGWITRVLELSSRQRWMPVEDDTGLEANGYTIAFPLRRDEEVFGLMLVDAASGSMTQDTRAVLQILADQVAIAIDDSRLVEENVRLERKLAERERLATLGQMAATVAHEIKNPLSAIKSIAQVMGEDKNLNEDYARDLSLIVGETDRLGQSVTQLLTFARREAPRELPMRANQLVEAVVRLFEVNAQSEGKKLHVDVRSEEELNGAAVSAVRVALSNLLINALQATPAGGTISITEKIQEGHLVIAVEDGGAGIPSELRQRIWEPFFTTKQRGTGLGLAIVRKRMQEAEGTARLASSTNGKGARFELWVPLT